MTEKDKFDCIFRELTMRRRVYPRLIARGNMTREKANREIEIMEAILDDYRQTMKAEQLL